MPGPITTRPGVSPWRSPRTRCEVCGSTDLVTTFSRIDMQQVCATCESTYSTYFRKDGAPFRYPATWGKVIAVEVETIRLSDTYVELDRRTERMGEVCHQVLEGRLNEEEGLAEIGEGVQGDSRRGRRPATPSSRPSTTSSATRPATCAGAASPRATSTRPKRVEGGGKLDAYHYWVVDVLPSE